MAESHITLTRATGWRAARPVTLTAVIMLSQSCSYTDMRTLNPHHPCPDPKDSQSKQTQNVAKPRCEVSILKSTPKTLGNTVSGEMRSASRIDHECDQTTRATAEAFPPTLITNLK